MTISINEDLDEGGYIAECIDIPGCMSQGETRKEALANLMDAVALCEEVIAEDVQTSGAATGFLDEPFNVKAFLAHFYKTGWSRSAD